jgi:hypothetical protein
VYAIVFLEELAKPFRERDAAHAETPGRVEIEKNEGRGRFRPDLD